MGYAQFQSKTELSLYLIIFHDNRKQKIFVIIKMYILYVSNLRNIHVVFKREKEM